MKTYSYNCDICEKEFETNRVQKRVCSASCKKERARRVTRSKYVKKPRKPAADPISQEAEQARNDFVNSFLTKAWGAR